MLRQWVRRNLRQWASHWEIHKSLDFDLDLDYCLLWIWKDFVVKRIVGLEMWWYFLEVFHRNLAQSLEKCFKKYLEFKYCALKYVKGMKLLKLGRVLKLFEKKLSNQMWKKPIFIVLWYNSSKEKHLLPVKDRSHYEKCWALLDVESLTHYPVSYGLIRFNSLISEILIPLLCQLQG